MVNMFFFFGNSTPLNFLNFFPAVSPSDFQQLLKEMSNNQEDSCKHENIELSSTIPTSYASTKLSPPTIHMSLPNGQSALQNRRDR